MYRGQGTGRNPLKKARKRGGNQVQLNSGGDASVAERKEPALAAMVTGWAVKHRG